VSWWAVSFKLLASTPLVTLALINTYLKAGCE
jgi:hypothetical protein